MRYRPSVKYAANPLLASKTPVWRSKFIVAAIAVGFVVLAGRAAYVQVFDNAFFQRQGKVRYVRTFELPGLRGRILDRNGLLLASSVVAPSVWAIPEDVDRDDPQVRAKLRLMAKLLGINMRDLDKKLKNQNKTFIWISREVDEPIARKVAALNIQGIYQTKEYKRQYPDGESVAHVVGFTSIEDNGQEGIELAFDKALAGKPGMQRVIKDRLGHAVESVGETVPPLDGQDIQLSIDSKIQFFAYQTVREAVITNKAKAGSVIVVDAQTGEVLALANYPSFNPNNRSEFNKGQLRNHALTDAFEPGSTMKPVTIASALQLGRITPQTVIDTSPGRLSVSGRTIHDDSNFGVLTVQGVVQKSSNVGATKISQRMKPQEMWNFYNALGFGQRPQITFPGVVGGVVHPWKRWRPIEQATMSYGYGLSASLLQIAHAYTAFAHDGQVLPLTLLKANGPVLGVQVFSPKVAAEVRQMLHMAAAPGGTAPLARTVGYSVGGKTGTAHAQVGKGYASNAYRAWYTGMSPIDKPRIVVSVMINEPRAGRYFGGEVAAPVFSTVVQETLRMLNVSPDLAVTSQIVSAPAVQESF
ncbi:MAG: penicillin-binding protein 2 [Burkholderiaceae bacterium]|jgi:cell division protein FtsI (penicillin-binding protein 3)|nr:penicillin-binding protein 2 [Burkholderiaceae bacterium]